MGDWHTINAITPLSIIGYCINVRAANNISDTIKEAKCTAIGVQSDSIASEIDYSH